MRFDANNDGSLDRDEWRKALDSIKNRGLSGAGPGGPSSPRRPANSINRWLFGETGRLFSLGHLWFLWYLLVFVTTAPPFAWVAGRILVRNESAADRLGRGLIRNGLAPLVLGLISLPCLMQAPSFFGWGLGFATGIGGQFPDFLFRGQRDWPFYFAYFMTGWWLIASTDLLPVVGRSWLPILMSGIAVYVAAQWFAARYSRQTQSPGYELLRFIGFGLLAVAAAYTTWGFVGLFQRHLDRPSRLGRYFADSALWIYLVHQDILGPVIRGIRPLELGAVPGGLLASILTIGIAAGLYELIIRPTPLIWIFGPGRSRPGTVEDVRPAVPADEATEVEFGCHSGRLRIGQIRGFFTSYGLTRSRPLDTSLGRL